MLRMPSQSDLGAIESIKYLKAFYGKYADEKYTNDHRRKSQSEIDSIAELQSSVFTEDALWDAGVFGVFRGRDAIRKNLSQGPWSFAVHYYLSPLIEVSGQNAKGRWSLWQVGTLVSGETPIVLSAVTEDDYVLTSEGWRISKMVQTLKFMTHHGVPWSEVRNNPYGS